MPSELAKQLLNLLENAEVTHVTKPWGREVIIDTGEFLLKYIEVDHGHRTSLQYHERKDEVTIVAHAAGGARYVDGLSVDNRNPLRVKPHERHRVAGPIGMIELTTMDNDDVVRVEDDYGR